MKLKMLTKENCENALYNVKNGYRYKLPNCELNTFDYGVKVLEQLINEHFDNPPLKFEELKVGMWVWIKSCHSYEEITDLSDFGKIKLVDIAYGSIQFDENKFYRKQVQ